MVELEGEVESEEASAGGFNVAEDLEAFLVPGEVVGEDCGEDDDEEAVGEECDVWDSFLESLFEVPADHDDAEGDGGDG